MCVCVCVCVSLILIRRPRPGTGSRVYVWGCVYAPTWPGISFWRYPFLDLVGTLDDQSASLTPSDILEWGNPSDGSDLKSLLSYSPYEQIKSQKYPSVMLTVAKSDALIIEVVSMSTSKSPGCPSKLILFAS